MAYEATAQLFQRQADLAKKRAQSEYESAIGDLATQYRQANRDLEANLESRGILRSGEGMRGRVRLGAAEKAAQLAAETARQGALDQADLTHLQQLAELQAKGYTGGGDVTPTPGTPAPSPGTPATPTPVTPPRESDVVVRTPVEPGTPQDPSCQITPQPGNPPTGYRYKWNPTKCTWELEYMGAPPTVGGRPVTGGDTPTEINPPTPGTVGGGASGPRPSVQPPLTSGGVVVRPGDTPSESRPPSMAILPAPGGVIGGPDRRLPNGGGVVNGIYIPPGIDWGALAPQPVRPNRGAF